ncbi:MAG: XdhC family protein [Bradymonadia bacterium]|jgi:xanthine dehydrogenase accessory factor
MQFFDYVARCEAAGTAFAVLTVIEASYSSPGRSSFKMCLKEDGSIFGSIGGGALEFSAMKEAKEMMRRGESLKTIDLVLEEKADGGIGMACGGKVKVLIECFAPSKPLYIFGGGHIGSALTEFATRVGFAVTIIDDRPEFAADHVHPLAKEVRCESYETASLKGDFRQDAFFVIVTHQHSGDGVTLRGLLKRPELNPRYIGLIGSAKKLAKVFERMRDEGISEESLRSVYAPIGVNHGGQSASEIALAIATEVVARKYNIHLASSMRNERDPWKIVAEGSA